jgi:hypothetical protein
MAEVGRVYVYIAKVDDGRNFIQENKEYVLMSIAYNQHGENGDQDCTILKFLRLPSNVLETPLYHEINVEICDEEDGLYLVRKEDDLGKYAYFLVMKDGNSRTLDDDFSPEEVGVEPRILAQRRRQNKRRGAKTATKTKKNVIPRLTTQNLSLRRRGKRFDVLSTRRLDRHIDMPDISRLSLADTASNASMPDISRLSLADTALRGDNPSMPDISRLSLADDAASSIPDISRLSLADDAASSIPDISRLSLADNSTKGGKSKKRLKKNTQKKSLKKKI